jgi:putative CocE/NonD family hydrolase
MRYSLSRLPLLIAAELFLLVSPRPVAAQGKEYVKTHYSKFEYKIPMRDGVNLFTAVYVPKDTSQKYPILMIRTQSGVRPYGEDQFPNDLGPSPLFGKEGYIFVYQDIRGRWMSEGTFENMRPHNPAKKTPKDIDESSDTYDSIEWLLKKVPNHNGKVGLYGISYRGFLVAAGMIDAHPAVKAAIPGAPIMDWFIGDDWHHNGALFLSHAFFYMPLQGKPRPMPTMNPPKLFDFGTPDAYDFYLRMGPLANADAKYFKGEVPYWNEVLKHNTYDDFWKARNLRPHLRNIKPAVMTVGGWFDAENLFGALETYQNIEANSPDTNHTLVMGPWLHGGWNSGQGDGSSLGNVSFNSKTSEYYSQKLELPFFEFHLKGKGDFKTSKARIFETGTNQWRDYATWPPKNTKPLALYFHGSGRLAEKPPADAGKAAFDEYTSDPAKPVPYFDKIGIRMLPEYMTADQRFAARRPDVLVYETEVLDHDITVAGPILADLHVSTSGTDSDWIVKLIDVYPDDTPDPSPNPTGVRMGGYQQLVRGEVMRGRFRDSFEKPTAFTPGNPTAVKYKLPDACHTFRRGHKIMVQVQSSWFPLVDRNPQTFVDISTAKESDFQKATQRLYRSKELPSRLVLNVLP